MDKYFIAGLISGTSQVISGHPFDTMKVNIQNNNMKNYVLNIKNLYKGISYPLVTNSILTSLQFGCYNYFKKRDNTDTISSAATGLVISFVSSPIDRFKIKKQILSSNIYNKPFKGLYLTISREIPANVIYFNTYNYMRSNEYNILLSGGTSGILSWLLTYPIDVIKTRIQSDNFKDIQSAIKKKNFFHGLCPCLARAMIVNSIGFYVYEYIIRIN
tara:strand:+ start:357 stop:1004 length:648 start_codon:yes stop_codon:yes gene_type:complete